MHYSTLFYKVLMTVALTAFTLTLAAQEDAAVPTGPRKASRSTVLVNAKNLRITTTANKSYYYVVSSESKPILHLDPDDVVRIGSDEFTRSTIQSMRFMAMPRLYLDEDSTVHGNDYAVNSALLALRRSFRLGGWNTLILPFELTGPQVIEVFGEGTQLARARGAEVDDVIAVEFDLIDLNTDAVVLSPNLCYLIRPTREPDVEAGKSISTIISGQRLYGPIYLLPNVSMKAGMSPQITYIRQSDNTTVVRMRGTYERLDNTVMRNRTTIANKKLAPGTWSFDDDGYITENTDSTLLQAFRCWFQNLDETKKLRFYINGVEDDLNGDGLIDAIAQPLNIRRLPGGPVFDLQGRRVGTLEEGQRIENLDLPRGIYLVRGRKYIIK